MILVCPLSKLADTVARHGARRVISLLGEPGMLIRPPGIAAANHLFVHVHDIDQPGDGQILCGTGHVEELLGFVRGWDRRAPMVVHCWAGISRSTAVAFLAACALQPGRDERAIAGEIRAASPTAYPNRRIVALGDEILGRGGRMKAAIEAIGRGQIASEGVPFALPLAEAAA
ncbi:MAG TPA: protein tyrosine phosphatase [Hyphomicrobiales bacterium]|nr:protein tyrosine phosphatase [Hyphomicrobiales bacterium]